MTFEEFFKKKKISLQLLQEAEPALFSEFELHYGQMGEKSFDHTKKYWFNQLRHKFPAPPEVKAEKVVIENPLAEQTIADTLTEPAAPAPNVGFKPRFKAAMASKPVTEEAKVPESPVIENKSAADIAPAPALGFKPKFKAAAPPKPAPENTEAKEEKSIEEANPAPALGFKPKFRASAPPKPVEENKPVEEEIKGEEEPKEEAKPALGFKPKFRAASPPKQVEVTEEKPAPEEKTEETALEQPEAAPKLGFKPRFNPKNIKPKEE